MSSDKKDTVRIDLTAAQRQTVKAAIDKDAEAIELTVQELEQRITPSETVPGPVSFFRLAGNHNETLLG